MTGRSGLAIAVLGLVLALASTDTAHAQTQPEIRVGSFQIDNLGADAQAEYERSLLDLANIVLAMDADVIAVQGVHHSDTGREQLGRLVDMLNRAASSEDTAAYRAVAGDRIQPGTDEDLAVFLWRAPAELIAGPQPIAGAESPGGFSAFRQVPQTAVFRAGDFEFQLLNAHQAPGPGDAGLEAIARWLEAQEKAGRPAAIVAGPIHHPQLREVLERSRAAGQEPPFRFPRLEALAGPGPAPGERGRTGIDAGAQSIGSTMVVSRAVYPRIAVQPRWGEDVGVVDFDRRPGLGWATRDPADAARLLSSHRPLWLRIGIGEAPATAADKISNR